MANSREFDRLELTVPDVQYGLVDEDHAGAKRVEVAFGCAHRALNGLGAPAGLEFAWNNDLFDADQVIEEGGEDIVELALHLWLQLAAVL